MCVDGARHGLQDSPRMRLAPLALLMLLTISEAGARELAFPGAVGFGAEARGGRGGDVYHVTTLADAGPGSLRHAVESATGPRTIVFEVAGTIDLGSPLVIREKSNLTIAGQTSPGGVTTRGYPVEVVRSSHVVLRHLRFRPGDIHARGVNGKPGRGNADLGGASADALSILDSDHVIVDHVSASWSMDETLSVTKSKFVTVQHSIISESLNDSYHPEGLHGYGSLVRGTGKEGYSFYKNLWAHHERRSPSLGGEQDPPLPGETREGLDVDLVGNVIYDWGFLPTHTLSDPILLRVNLLGNLWIARSTGFCACVLFQIEGSAEEVRVFPSGNRVDLVRNGELDSRPLGGADVLGPVSWALRPFRFDRPLPRARSTGGSFRRLLRTVGASLWRDAVDARVLEQVASHSGGLIDSQDDVGGWPVIAPEGPPALDADRDGMADAWERRRGLDPSDASDRNGYKLRRAYTNLEVYLHQLTRR